MDINRSIKKLVSYALEKNLITENERIYSTNLLLDVLNLDEYVQPKEEYSSVDLESTLREILDWAVSQKLIEDNIVSRDLFDTKVMNCFVMRPQSVIDTFDKLYKESPGKATDWYYSFSKDTDYIRSYRVKKDLKWKTSTKYGDLDITINLSKPEKDPKAIAAARNAKASSYPRCQLCKENEGYRGRLNHPARETLRLVPLSLDGDRFFLQYSPYSYFNEHCIVFNAEHVPMCIDEKCFRHLLSFAEQFPHYLLGSNADLPIVGGSILSHDHYQGGNYLFPMLQAKSVFDLSFQGYEDIFASYLYWPLSVIRIASKDRERLLSLACRILSAWKEYSDEENHIHAYTDGVRHNTISPICHKIGDEYALDLALRNNLTTKEHPLGLFHPHEELWHIKKENIGLIEVMGLAVLPSRLRRELSLVKDAILNHKDIASIESISKHADWVKEFSEEYPEINESNIDMILKKEVGKVFMKVLECCGVFKQNEQGYQGIRKFVSSVR